MRDTVIKDNDSTITGNPNPYRWVHGIRDTSFADNKALGKRVGLCEGRELPTSSSSS